MKIKTFPKLIFVTAEEGDTSDEDFLLAHLNKKEALGELSSRTVGLYQFIEAQEVQESLPTSRKRKGTSVGKTKQ